MAFNDPFTWANSPMFSAATLRGNDLAGRVAAANQLLPVNWQNITEAANNPMFSAETLRGGDTAARLRAAAQQVGTSFIQPGGQLALPAGGSTGSAGALVPYSAPAAAAAAQQVAGGLGAAGGMGGGTPPTWLTAKLGMAEAPAGTNLGLRSLAAGSLGRASAYGAAGYFGGQLTNKVIGEHPNSAWDEALTGAVTGAGVGAGIGSLVPVVGTGIGAGVGAAAGGLIGYFGPKENVDRARDKEIGKQTEKLTKILDQYSVSPELREQALMQMSLYTSQAENKGQVKDIAGQIIPQVTQAILADQQATAAEEKRQRMIQANLAAAQAWLTPLMQQRLDKQLQYANTAAQAQEVAANNITDKGLRDSYVAQARSTMPDVAAQQAAMLQQIAMTPALYGYNTGYDQQVGTANTDLLSILNAQQMGAVGTPYALNPAAAR